MKRILVLAPRHSRFLDWCNETGNSPPMATCVHDDRALRGFGPDVEIVNLGWPEQWTGEQINRFQMDLEIHRAIQTQRGAQ